MRKSAAEMPAAVRRTCKPGPLRRPPGWPSLAMLAAGLVALLLAAACSSESVGDPDRSAGSGPSPEPAASPAQPPTRSIPPAPAARSAAFESSYAYLWRAAAAGSLGAETGQGATARLPADGAGGPAVPAPVERAVERQREPEAALPAPPDRDSWDAEAALPDANPSAADNAPESAATPNGDPSDENLPNRPGRGGQFRMEDYAQLSPYLEGIASWYGPNFHGKPTANGETYNQYGLTAAHPVLPIGTRVLVENLSNGRRVWLRINDRGPYAKGRVLDLSRIAAERLGIIAQGTAPVRITVLKWPETVEPSLGLKAFQQYTVQTAAYPEMSSAEELRERLQAQHPRFPFFVDRASNGFYAVAAGPFDDEREARQVARSIHRSGLNPIVKRYRN